MKNGFIWVNLLRQHWGIEIGSGFSAARYIPCERVVHYQKCVTIESITQLSLRTGSKYERPLWGMHILLYVKGSPNEQRFVGDPLQVHIFLSYASLSHFCCDNQTILPYVCPSVIATFYTNPPQHSSRSYCIRYIKKSFIIRILWHECILFL